MQSLCYGMRSTPHAFLRALPIISGLLCGAVTLPRQADAAGATPGSGLAALAARTPTLVGNGRPADGAPGFGQIALACTGAAVDSCWDAGGPTRVVNVGTFFDRRRPSAPTHFFIKYFQAPAMARCRLEGFTFVPNRTGTVFQAAGAILTAREAPTVPSPDQLTQELQRPLVHSAGANTPTCVDLAGAAIDVNADQGVWLVLQFPDPPDTNFIGVAAEGNMNDEPCDFLTRDNGELWYRPDPMQSRLDWAFVAHYTVLPSKAEAPWHAVKSLYR
jgi:hypothetical protein